MNFSPVPVELHAPRCADTRDEMLCARTRVAIADLDARQHASLDGARVVEYLQRLLARDASSLVVGTALKAAWLSDGGGVRGAAAVARCAEEQFWILSASRDDHWIHATADLFGVNVRDVSAERKGLAVLGPYARATLDAAGIESGDLRPLAFRTVAWNGVSVVLSRLGEHGGYELWMAGADATTVRDRVTAAGAPFGLAVLSTAAMDGLDVEAGIPRPGRDYIPAHDNEADEPSPLAWGLAGLIDPEHAGFNGRNAYLAAAAKERRRLMGVEIDTDIPAPHVRLMANGRCAGRTLTSVYSPVLRRAIALAQLEGASSRPGSKLSLTLPPGPNDAQVRTVGATVVDLPFLQAPGGTDG